MQSNSHNGCMSSLLASWPLALSSALASPWSFTQVLHLLPSLAMGAALGFFGGVFGIGGGIIAIPALVLLGGMEQAQAQGTALVMMVPNLLIGWWRYSLKNPVRHWPAGQPHHRRGGALCTWLAPRHLAKRVQRVPAADRAAHAATDAGTPSHTDRG